MTEPTSLSGCSGLSDAQLGAMWNHIQELYPSECERIANPPEDEDEEESKQSTRFIQGYVDKHHRLNRDWRQRDAIYLDLLDYRGRQHLARVQECGSIGSRADYWIVRNSLSCHSERLDTDQTQQLLDLLSAYEAGRTDLPGTFPR